MQNKTWLQRPTENEFSDSIFSSRLFRVFFSFYFLALKRVLYVSCILNSVCLTRSTFDFRSAHRRRSSNGNLVVQTKRMNKNIERKRRVKSRVDEQTQAFRRNLQQLRQKIHKPSRISLPKHMHHLFYLLFYFISLRLNSNSLLIANRDKKIIYIFQSTKK